MAGNAEKWLEKGWCMIVNVEIGDGVPIPEARSVMALIRTDAAKRWETAAATNRSRALDDEILLPNSSQTTTNFTQMMASIRDNAYIA